MIQILPAIDIIGGRCVRLTKGDYGSKKVYDASVLDMALSYEDCGVGRIHIVDLDGAKISSPANLRTLESVASRVGVEIEWGGGLSSLQSLRDAFNAGATHCIVGSIAARQSSLFQGWLGLFPKGRLILGADAREGRIAVKGWQEDTSITVSQLVSIFRDSLEEVVCTDIGRDGMLQGPSFSLYESLQGEFPELSFTVSGGISSMDDIVKLSSLGLRKVIVGKAIYENRISLEDIKRWHLQNE